VVILVGLAVFHGARPLLLWWEWTLGLVMVPAVLVGTALGVPGRLRLLPLRGLLILPLLVVPLSGLLFVPRDNPEWIQDSGNGETAIAVIRIRLSEDAIDDRAVVSVTVDTPGTSGQFRASSPDPEENSDRIAVHRDGSLLVQVERLLRSPPLWWLPPSGTVTGLIVRASVSVGEGDASIRITSSPALFALARDRVEALLVDYRLLRRHEETLLIPGSPGRFLQPGSYTVYRRSHSSVDDLPGEVLSHPPELFYR
jgi:hypothetical protein